MVDGTGCNRKATGRQRWELMRDISSTRIACREVPYLGRLGWLTGQKPGTETSVADV